MDSQQETVVFFTILVAGCAAAGAALFIAYVAHYDFGLSREQIRNPAMVGAIIIASLLAVEFIGSRLRKP